MLNQLIYIVFQVSVGISHAASILVSRYVTTGRAAAAARMARTAPLQGGAVAAVVAVAYLAAPKLVLGAFLDPTDAETLTVAAQLLLVAAVVQFVDSGQNIGVGLLRGLDDTKAGFIATGPSGCPSRCCSACSSTRDRSASGSAS